MNYQMEVFHQVMIDTINKSGLPIGAAYYIVKDCLNELEMGYRKAIYDEKNSKPETVTEEIDTIKKVSHATGEEIPFEKTSESEG